MSDFQSAAVVCVHHVSSQCRLNRCYPLHTFQWIYKCCLVMIGIQGVISEKIVFNTSHTSGSAKITGEHAGGMHHSAFRERQRKNPLFSCSGEFSCYDKHIHAVWTVVTEGSSSAVVICCKHMQGDKNQLHLTKINFVNCNHQNSWFSVKLFKSLSSHNSFPSYLYGTEILCDKLFVHNLETIIMFHLKRRV